MDWETAYHVFALWARMLAYPTTAYALISLTIIKKEKTVTRDFYIHVGVALFFMLLWVGLFVRRVLYVSGDVVQNFFDFTLVPLLIIIIVLSLRSMWLMSRNETNEIKKKLKQLKEVSDGNSIIG